MPTSPDERRILIGLNIHYCRRARRLTQVELAEAVGISSNYLSQVERGCKSISLDKLLRISDELGVDVKIFFDFGKILDGN